MLRQVMLGSVVCLVACGSSSNKTVDGPGSGSATVTFADIYSQVIMPNCSCHTSATGTGVTKGMLDMTSEAMAYTDLVGVGAKGTGCGSATETVGTGSAYVRVIPGDAKDSLLYIKIDPADPDTLCGGNMPLGANPAGLGSDDITLVKNWINGDNAGM